MSAITPVSAIIPQLSPAKRRTIREFDDKAVLFEGKSGWAVQGSKPVAKAVVAGLVELGLVRCHTQTRFGRQVKAAKLTDIGSVVADRLKRDERTAAAASIRQYAD